MSPSSAETDGDKAAEVPVVFEGSGIAELGTARREDGEDSDEFDYSDDHIRPAGHHEQVFRPVDMPAHLVTGVHNSSLISVMEEDEEDEEEAALHEEELVRELQAEDTVEEIDPQVGNSWTTFMVSTTQEGNLVSAEGTSLFEQGITGEIDMGPTSSKAGVANLPSSHLIGMLNSRPTHQPSPPAFPSPSAAIKSQLTANSTHLSSSIITTQISSEITPLTSSTIHSQLTTNSRTPSSTIRSPLPSTSSGSAPPCPQPNNHLPPASVNATVNAGRSLMSTSSASAPPRSQPSTDPPGTAPVNSQPSGGPSATSTSSAGSQGSFPLSPSASIFKSLRMGSQGAQGSQGSQGMQPSNGTLGAQGSQGTQPSNGTLGAQGSQGTQPSNGTLGAQGSQGTQPSNGTLGAQGSQGTQGSAPLASQELATDDINLDISLITTPTPGPMLPSPPQVPHPSTSLPRPFPPLTSPHSTSNTNGNTANSSDSYSSTKAHVAAAKLVWPQQPHHQGSSPANSGSALVDEWEVANLTREQELAQQKLQQGQAAAERALVYPDAVEQLKACDVQPYRAEVLAAMDSEADGWWGRLKGMLRAAPQPVREEQIRLLSLAKTPFDNANPLHFRLLSAVYLSYTGATTPPARYGDHWAVLGFQGTDPATDLRGCGVLGLLHLLYLHYHHPSSAQNVHRLSRHPTQEFPLAIVSLNATKWTLQVLRSGTLLSAARKSQCLEAAASDFYAGAMYCFYLRWCKGATMSQSGFVLKEVGDACIKKPAATIAQAAQHLPGPPEGC